MYIWIYIYICIYVIYIYVYVYNIVDIMIYILYRDRYICRYTWKWLYTWDSIYIYIHIYIYTYIYIYMAGDIHLYMYIHERFHCWFQNNHVDISWCIIVTSCDVARMTCNDGWDCGEPSPNDVIVATFSLVNNHHILCIIIQPCMYV